LFDASVREFLVHFRQVANTIDRKEKLMDFLSSVLPDNLPTTPELDSRLSTIKTRDDFLKDVDAGMTVAPMAVRLTPHILSMVDWSNALTDGIRRQFVPLKSALAPDLPELSLDSLHESHGSPVPGLVHRYPEKVLFLGQWTS
jgi:lysine 2,3-aminomutase